MRLTVDADVTDRRSGVAATARQLGLTGHGETEDQALASLRRVAAAWAEGLLVVGGLDRALTRARVQCEEDNLPGFTVDLRRLSDAEAPAS